MTRKVPHKFSCSKVSLKCLCITCDGLTRLLVKFNLHTFYMKTLIIPCMWWSHIWSMCMKCGCKRACICKVWHLVKNVTDVGLWVFWRVFQASATEKLKELQFPLHFLNTFQHIFWMCGGRVLSVEWSNQLLSTTRTFRPFSFGPQPGLGPTRLKYWFKHKLRTRRHSTPIYNQDLNPKSFTPQSCTLQAQLPPPDTPGIWGKTHNFKLCYLV